MFSVKRLNPPRSRSKCEQVPGVILSNGVLRDVAAVGLLVALGAILFWARFTLRPDLTADSRWVFGEHGNQLHRVDQVLAGRLVYRDFAIQYGPLPTYVAAAFAAVGGNTIATNQVYHLTLRLASLVVFYVLMRRAFSPGRSLLLGLVGGLPTLFGSTHIEYISCEMLAVLTLLALYAPPDRRGVGTAFALGVVLGMCQWIKFGGAIVAGAAIVAVDLIWLAANRPNRIELRRFFIGSAAILGGFLLLEGLLVALVWMTSPTEVARDALWPTFMLNEYAAIPKEHRLPRYVDLKELVVFQWVWLSALMVGLGGLAMDVKSRFRRECAAAAAACDVGLLFYVIGAVVYLKHAYLFYQYGWAVMPAGCLAVGRLPGWIRASFLLSWMPALAMGLKITFLNATFAGWESYRLPNGERVYVDVAGRDLLDRVGEAVADQRQRHPDQSVLLVGCGWYGLGFYHYFGVSPPVRNVLVQKHMLRPYDHRELLQALDRLAALMVVRSPGAPDPIEESLPAEVVKEIHRRFALRDEHQTQGGYAVQILERIDPAEPTADLPQQVRVRGQSAGIRTAPGIR